MLNLKTDSDSNLNLAVVFKSALYWLKQDHGGPAEFMKDN